MTDDIDWLKDNLISTPVVLDSWGEVNLVSATTIEPHSIPWFFLTDDDGNILYEECCSKGINGGIVVWDIFIEDIDRDGRLDIWTVVCGDEPARPPEAGRIVCRFYQAGQTERERETERQRETERETETETETERERQRLRQRDRERDRD